MKIGIDGRLIDQTGVGRYIRNLYSYLQKKNKDRYVLLQPRIRWHSLSEQLFFPFWLLGKKVDLVHFPYFSFPLFCPKKFVVTIHDLIPWYFRTGKASSLPGWLYSIKHFFYKQLLYWGARRARKIIAVSESTKKEIVKCLEIKPEKVEVIYEGVDDKLKRKATSHQPPATSYFLYVGNAYPHKNLERLIGAFGKLNDETMKLIFVGPDDYFYKKLKEKVKSEKLDSRIIFFGPASDSELACLYSKAIALVNPSLMEGFGLPGLEAMALGCPVVCSGISVFKEIYGEAAEYFNQKDVDDIKSKLMKVLEDKKRQAELINKGKKQADRYSWKKCAKETLKIYESSISL